jgi:hypothetical protein
MNRTQIDWRSGNVTFWALDFLDVDKPLLEQLDDLKEDLAQAQYGGLVLDIGWFPSFSEEGTFVVRVVQQSDWDAPLFLEEPATLSDMLASVGRAVQVAETASAS